MFKKLSPHTSAFDCEWAPCPATARRLLGLPAETSDREATAALWRHYAKEDKPDERPFLKLILCRVVSIAAVFRSVDAQGRVSLHLRAHSLDEMDEAAMIVRFLEGVAAKPYQLWGFSSENADLPILRQRAIALGAPTISKRVDNWAAVLGSSRRRRRNQVVLPVNRRRRMPFGSAGDTWWNTGRCHNAPKYVLASAATSRKRQHSTAQGYCPWIVRANVLLFPP